MAADSGFLVTPEHEARMSRFAAILVGALVLCVTACPVYFFPPGTLPPLRGDDLVILILFFYARKHNAKLGRRFFTPTLAIGMCIWLVYVLAKIGGVVMTYLVAPGTFLINDVYQPLMYIRTMVVFLLVGSLHIQTKHFWKLLGFVALLGAGEAFLALLQTILPGAFVEFCFRLYSPKKISLIGSVGSVSRVIGTMFNPIYLGAILSAYSSTALALGLFSKRSYVRIFGLAATVFMAYAGIFFAQTRTTIFAVGLVVFGTLVLSVALPKGRWMPLLVMIGLVLLGTVGAGLLQDIELPPRVEAMVGTMRTQGAANGVLQATGRLEIWQGQLEALAAGGSFWVGGGVTKDKLDNPDNGFLQAVMTGGIFGLISVCGFYIFMIWTCLATFFKARRSQYAPIVLALLGFVWAMLAFEITVEFISESCLTVLAGTVMGLIVVVKREVDREVATRYETERDQLAAGPADEDVYWGDGQTSAASDWPGHSM